MDINSLLAMMYGGGGNNGSQFMPKMPTFPGAGGNNGVQSAASAASRALAQPVPQQQAPISAMMSPQAMMGLAQMTQSSPSVPISQNIQFPAVGGGTFNTTVNADTPTLPSQGSQALNWLRGLFGT